MTRASGLASASSGQNDATGQSTAATKSPRMASQLSSSPRPAWSHSGTGRGWGKAGGCGAQWSGGAGEDVPRRGEGGGDRTLRLRPGPADADRGMGALDGLGLAASLSQPVVAALEVGGLVGEQTGDHGQRLF